MLEGSAEKTPLIKLLRPWLVITGLDFKDAVHLTSDALWSAYQSINTKLGEVIDVLDDDQLREAACRCLGSVTVYGEMIQEGDVAVHHGITISWTGNRWAYVTDSKLRLRETSSSFVEGLAAINEALTR
jgi:hypothetical protein